MNNTAARSYDDYRCFFMSEMVNTIKWKVVLLAKLFQLSHRAFEDP